VLNEGMMEMLEKHIKTVPQDISAVEATVK
jgi:hypothetical protein